MRSSRLNQENGKKTVEDLEIMSVTAMRNTIIWLPQKKAGKKEVNEATPEVN